jgi:G3E family GTPase
VQALRLDGVITAVDAVNGMATLDNHLEAVKQAAVADRIVLTKTDLEAGAAGGADLILRLANLNPGARIVRAAAEEASAAALFDCGLYDPAAKTADVARWLNEEGFRDRGHERHELEHPGHDHAHGHHHHDVNRHDRSISAFTLIHDQPVPLSAVQMFLDLLQSAHAERLLRMKGIICLAEDPARPLVIHAVQAVMHPPARLKEWQGGDRRTRLVMITKDLPEEYVRQLFDAFMGKPSIDRPDGEALANNPLAIAGMRV